MRLLMSAYKIYKHYITTNVFGIRDKIKEQQKSNRNANKNRKNKN
jgi:hypothetical protein